jgi:hypothetical protein
MLQFLQLLPADGINAAFEIAGLRHVLLAALKSRYSTWRHAGNGRQVFFMGLAKVSQYFFAAREAGFGPSVHLLQCSDHSAIGRTPDVPSGSTVRSRRPR